MTTASESAAHGLTNQPKVQQGLMSLDGIQLGMSVLRLSE